MIWLEFVLCVVVIGVAGVKLSRYGDAIADKTGLGGAWVGVVLLATVTSLPELVTGITSVTVAQTPEIAVGDVLGSCVFNLLIIVVLDFIHRKESVYSSASQGHILSAAFGIMLIGFTGFNILLSSQGGSYQMGHVGLYSPFLLIFYLIMMRTVYRYESAQLKIFSEAESDQYPDLSKQQAVVRYIVAASFVVAAGSLLPFIGKQLAHQMGWYESFVGTMFIAFATSLPEIVVTVAALRVGALDMAIGNLFGSNLFNILILAIDDVFYIQGSLLNSVSPTHAVSALSAIMMTGVAIVGLFYRPRTRVLKLVGWTSIILFCVYLINTYVAFIYGH
ncbi:MAG: sodium:calcium antiporter [Gammaproteobacteria bacterium]|jgi:cation:H+ antiporter|nr:sodium:calcium antiporter [Gammaproteobacteria bacterium]